MTRDRARRAAAPMGRCRRDNRSTARHDHPAKEAGRRPEADVCTAVLQGRQGGGR